MSLQASAWYVERWKDRVLHKYQSRGFTLSRAVTPPSRIEGKKLHFPIAGKGVATKMKTADDVKPMNADRSTVTVEAEGYQAAEYIYHLDLNRMTARENEVAEQTAAMALGRKHDQVIYDAVNANSGSYGTVVGDFASAWDLAKALEACDRLQDNDVPWDGDVWCPLPSRAWNQMLSFNQFNSSDFIGGDLPFVKATDSRFWNGVNWFLAPNELFPLSGTDRTFYIWHMSSIGSGDNAEGNGINSVFSWENIKTAWLTNNWMDIGSKVLLTEGIAECRMKSDSAITVS